MSGLSGRARWRLWREPEGTSNARWYLMIGLVFALMPLPQLAEEGIRTLYVWGMLTVGLAWVLRGLAETLPARRLQWTATLRVAHWVSMTVGVVLAVWGAYYLTL